MSYSKLKDFVVKAWRDTYPDEENNKKSFQERSEKIKQQAEQARVEKERMDSLTEEELAEYEKNIPEEKRRALVFVKGEEKQEPLSKRLRRRIYTYVKESAVGDELKKHGVEFKDFEEELDRLAEGGKYFGENVKTRITDSDNKVVELTKMALNSVNLSGTTKAVERMQKVDPDFNIFELEDDAKEIFTEIYEAFLRRDLEFIQKVADNEALGYFSATIAKWEQMEAKMKHENIWFMDSVHLERAEVVNSLPVFTFTAHMQEIETLVSTNPETEGEIVGEQGEGIQNNHYVFMLTLHDDPDLEVVGHGWKIIEFRLANKQKMIV